MYIIINNEMYNTRKIGSIEVNSLNPSELRYMFRDGMVIMEDLKTPANVTKKMNVIAEKTGFTKTTSNVLINPKHIVDIKQNAASPEKLVYVLVGSKPVEEIYATPEEVVKKVEEKIKALAPIEVEIDDDDDDKPIISPDPQPPTPDMPDVPDIPDN